MHVIRKEIIYNPFNIKLDEYNNDFTFVDQNPPPPPINYKIINECIVLTCGKLILFVRIFYYFMLLTNKLKGINLEFPKTETVI